jgi:hypothetical protein
MKDGISKTLSEETLPKTELRIVPLDEKKTKLATDIAKAQVYKGLDVMTDMEVIETIISKKKMGGLHHVFIHNVRVFATETPQDELKLYKACFEIPTQEEDEV